MNKKTSAISLILVIVIGTIIFFVKDGLILSLDKINSENAAAAAAAVNSPFAYNFAKDGTVQETSEMDQSSSPYWWLNSGGQFILLGGIGKTVQGELSANNKWRILYSKSNPTDTDNGLHPQNIFRLVTRSTWQNLKQEVYFNISKDNVSSSTNRNASNGLLLFNRYRDGNNLYYTGIRVDGHAIIKKKLAGTYYTLAERPTFNSSVYDRETNMNLLPKNTWIGLRSVVKTNADGTVNIKLYMDKGKTGNWALIAEATDNGKTNGPVITDKAFAGIRTDFMDVSFDDYRIEEVIN